MPRQVSRLRQSQTVATFTDPGGAEGTSHYGASINWGDIPRAEPLSCRNPHSTARAVTIAETPNPMTSVVGTIKTASDVVPMA